MLYHSYCFFSSQKKKYRNILKKYSFFRNTKNFALCFICATSKMSESTKESYIKAESKTNQTVTWKRVELVTILTTPVLLESHE